MRNTMRHFAVAISLMLAMTLPSFSQQHPIVEKDYVAYLFTYFTGNHISEEAVCYAVSMDGYRTLCASGLTVWALCLCWEFPQLLDTLLRGGVLARLPDFFFFRFLVFFLRCGTSSK